MKINLYLKQFNMQHLTYILVTFFVLLAIHTVSLTNSGLSTIVYAASADPVMNYPIANSHEHVVEAPLVKNLAEKRDADDVKKKGKKGKKGKKNNKKAKNENEEKENKENNNNKGQEEQEEKEEQAKKEKKQKV